MVLLTNCFIFLDQVVPGETNQNDRYNIDILVVIGMSVRREQTSGYFRSPYIRYIQVLHMLRQSLEKQQFQCHCLQNKMPQNKISFVGALFEMVIRYLYTMNLDEQGMYRYELD